MARIRSIKPEFPHSESMGRVSRDARLCFVELWTICDDAGRTRGVSRMLASLLFPYDTDAPKKIDQWLEELEREECIIRYEVGGHQYIQVTNWRDHQKIDHPSKSKIPEPRESSRILANQSEILGEDWIGKEGIGEEGNGKDQGEEHSEVVASSFDDFWKSYPTGRKSSKGTAKAAWLKAVKKRPAAEIIAAAAEYASSPVGQGEYVKGPATWLNGECWDDDRSAWNRKPTGNGKTRDYSTTSASYEANQSKPNAGEM